ncbi:hypothetical protein [Hominenteromicrobium sp.]|uniref:hypothetical protein n=1 Tax=Hominenteromicrobium sp. TaxID=3073581 RepID=UPI00399BDEBA
MESMKTGCMEENRRHDFPLSTPMPARERKAHAGRSLAKALIAREAMALQEAEVA